MLGSSDFILFAAKEAVDPVFERLDPPRRAAVIMALLALTLIGLFLITFIMVGGHWVRRMARHRPRNGGTTVSTRDESATGDVPQIVLPDEKSSDTMLLDRASKETKIE
jgi:hypothetical protein